MEAFIYTGVDGLQLKMSHVIAMVKASRDYVETLEQFKNSLIELGLKEEIPDADLVYCLHTEYLKGNGSKFNKRDVLMRVKSKYLDKELIGASRAERKRILKKRGK